MHEIVFANKIIEEAKKTESVKEITVEVGELAHIPADELKEALEKLVDWELKVIETKAKVKCSCGFKGEPKIIEKGHDYTIFQCPKCGRYPEVLEGEDIILKEVK